jgi:melibiose permease/lactose/raffinose/galactose permease
MNDIAYWGMVPALSSRADDRNLLTSMAIFCAGIGQFLAGTIIPAFTAGEYVIGGNAVTAYRNITFIICLFFAASTCITLFGVKEKPLPPRKESDLSKVSLRAVLKTLGANDQLIWVSVVFLVCSVSNLLLSGGLSMSYLYFEFGYNGVFLSIFGVLGNVAAVFLMVSFSALSKKFSRSQLVRTGVIGAIVGYGIMLLSGLILPGSMINLKFGALAFGNIFVFVGQTLIYMIMVICVANTVEYNEWKTGNRDEGIIFAVRPFITKLSGALVQFLIMVIYILVGVRTFTNQIADLENAASSGLIDAVQKTQEIAQVLSGVTSGHTIALLLCMTLLPSILLIISWRIFKAKYNITEEKYDKMLQDIGARR